MKYLIIKLLGIPVLFVFINLLYLLFLIEVFNDILTTLPILLFYTFISIDIVIRPISPKRDEYNRVVSVISFLLMPIIVFLPYFENKALLEQVLSLTIPNWILVMGTSLLTLGGFILLLSRIQLGKLGGPRIVIEDNHKLVTTGMYRYIRHPMYSGFLLLFIGYSVALGSIIMTIVVSAGFFLLFKKRMDIEEQLLFSSFGKEYTVYVKRTKRLIPFLY